MRTLISLTLLIVATLSLAFSGQHLARLKIVSCSEYEAREYEVDRTLDSPTVVVVVQETEFAPVVLDRETLHFQFIAPVEMVNPTLNYLYQSHAPPKLS